MYVNALWNIKNCGELARVSDFLPNFLFIKILKKKISADFLAAIFPNHLQPGPVPNLAFDADLLGFNLWSNTPKSRTAPITILNGQGNQAISCRNMGLLSE